METKEISYDHDENTEDERMITPVWKFNVFLDKISQSISDEEIARMKNFCAGGDLGRSALNKAKTAASFFQLLRDMTFLDSNNLLLLQAMLWHIGRKDLHQEMVLYAQECRKEPLHFFTPKEKPANGYRNVKFHVRGSEVNRQQMENLRGYVASLLCVKQTEVFLVGHSPSNSSILTFMVPAAAVSVLHTLTDMDKNIFLAMKVDYILLDDDTISIVGEEQRSTAISEKKEVAKLFQENEKLKLQIDKAQSCLVECTEELRIAKENEKYMQRSKDQAMMACLTLLHNHRPVTRLVDSLVSKSAFVYFKHCLQKFQEKFPGEMDTIEILLEAKELVACKTEREIWKQREKSLNLMIAFGRNELEMLRNVMMANVQGVHHNSHLKMGGAVVQQKTETIEIGFSIPTAVVRRTTAPVHTNTLYETRAVTKATERISKMLGKEQRQSIFRLLQLGKRRRKSLQHANDFLMKLYKMQSRQDTIFDFILETIHLLDDRTLEARVFKIIDDVQKECDQHEAAIRQGRPVNQQVRFTQGLQKRSMEPEALMRLHNDPKKATECVGYLQELAKAVEL